MRWFGVDVMIPSYQAPLEIWIALVPDRHDRIESVAQRRTSCHLDDVTTEPVWVQSVGSSHVLYVGGWERDQTVVEKIRDCVVVLVLVEVASTERMRLLIIHGSRRQDVTIRVEDDEIEE